MHFTERKSRSAFQATDYLSPTPPLGHLPISIQFTPQQNPRQQLTLRIYPPSFPGWPAGAKRNWCVSNLSSMSTWCVPPTHFLAALNFYQYRDRVDREREMSSAVTGSTALRKRTASSASTS